MDINKWAEKFAASITNWAPVNPAVQDAYERGVQHGLKPAQEQNSVVCNCKSLTDEQF